MNVSLAVLGLSGGELVVVLGAILILFGAKRIPEFAKGLGQGIKEFKKAQNEVMAEIHNSMDETHTPPSSKPTPPLPPDPEMPSLSAPVDHVESPSPSPNLAHNNPPDTVPKT
jgi:sec-independent protein translocase protein TatA